MTFLYEYSGILAACSALLFIVSPTFFVGLEYRKEPISFVTRHKKAGMLFKFGLVSTALLLFANTERLTHIYQIALLSPGVIVYLFGTACMPLVAFVDIDRHEPIHTVFTKGYFLLSALGAVLLSVQIFGCVSIVLGVAIAGGIGTIYLYFKLGLKAQAEYWGIMCAILWVVFFYVL